MGETLLQFHCNNGWDAALLQIFSLCRGGRLGGRWFLWGVVESGEGQQSLHIPNSPSVAEYGFERTPLLTWHMSDVPCQVAPACPGSQTAVATWAHLSFKTNPGWLSLFHCFSFLIPGSNCKTPIALRTENVCQASFKTFHRIYVSTINLWLDRQKLLIEQFEWS